MNLDRPRADQIANDVILKELRRVAKLYGLRTFTRHEFDAASEHCKGTVALRAFGSWAAALSATGLQLTPHRNPRRDQIPVELLLSEIGRIWGQLGHRPSKGEWEASNPRYSYTTYKTRFGGWLNACAEYIDYASKGVQRNQEDVVSPNRPKTIPTEKKRNIPLKLRLGVFQRDHFRRALCGRSPATDHGVTLHIDHVSAFSTGGGTTLNNLQTLCRDCNLGKGKDKIGST
jgi:hypothetical protein